MSPRDPVGEKPPDPNGGYVNTEAPELLEPLMTCEDPEDPLEPMEHKQQVLLLESSFLCRDVKGQH